MTALVTRNKTNPNRRKDEKGMTTAEYAVGILVAVTFAGIMFKVVSDGNTLKMVSDVVGTALKLVFTWK